MLFKSPEISPSRIPFPAFHSRFVGIVLVLTFQLMAVHFCGEQFFASAQSVHPDVFLHQPTPATNTNLKQLQTQGNPQIGLFYSQTTIQIDDALSPEVDEAVRQWELFLVGLELPYRVLEDTTLEKPLDKGIKLLILPGAEVLSAVQRDVIRQYMQRGGGVIASGRIGYLDERGVVQNDRFFKEIFSAEPSIDLPDSLQGLLHTIEGGHPATNGIAPGFKLNISRPRFGMAVLPISSRSLGQLKPYEPLEIRLIEDALNVSTMLLSGEYGAGRFVWMGFNPQDVSLDEQQQAAYQGLVLNAMAHVAQVPVVSIKKWPHGFTSASSFAVLPTLGYQPYSYRLGMDLVLGALERAKVKGTYFIVTSRLTDHPDIVDRIIEQGELALTSDTDEMLAKQPRDLQYNRIRVAKRELSRHANQVQGFYPPGGFYDPNTLRAMIDFDLDYMLSDASTLNVPVFLRWEDELDYRDSLLAVSMFPASVAGDSTMQATTGTQATAVDAVMDDGVLSDHHEVITMYPSLFSYTLDDRSGVSGPTAVKDVWKTSMENNFHLKHRSEGLFLFAFEPETMGLTQQRAHVLEEFGRYIRTQNTWIATLGDMASWWKDRSRVSAEIASIEAGGYTLLVTNQGDQDLHGLSLDFFLDLSSHRVLDLDAGSLDVWAKRDLERMLLVFETLPPGSHEIRLLDPSITSTEVIEGY